MLTAHTTARALSVVLWTGLSAMPAPALAQKYTFTRIADSVTLNLDPFETDRPSINSVGQVAFRARNTDGVQGVYRGDGGPITIIALDGRERDFSFMGRYPSVNASGQVAFAATFSGGEGIFRGDGGPLTTITDTERDSLSFLAFLPSMNDAGMVAFQAERSDFRNALLRGDGSAPPDQLVTALTQDFGGPIINDAGVIVFSARSGSISGLYRDDAGVIAPVELSSGPLASISDDPAINESGAVAFFAIDDKGQEGVFLRDQTGLVTIADGNGPTFLFNDPALNDKGQVAYSAYFVADFHSAIFLDGDIVIEAGDPLDGSIAGDVSTYRFALNNAGQIAFVAYLEDGRHGIYRADPLATCPADLNGDGLIDFADYLEFLNLFDAMDPRADFNHDGFIDFVDYLEFLNHYDAGC